MTFLTFRRFKSGKKCQTTPLLELLFYWAQGYKVDSCCLPFCFST